MSFLLSNYFYLPTLDFCLLLVMQAQTCAINPLSPHPLNERKRTYHHSHTTQSLKGRSDKTLPCIFQDDRILQLCYVLWYKYHQVSNRNWTGQKSHGDIFLRYKHLKVSFYPFWPHGNRNTSLDCVSKLAYTAEF